MPTLRVALNGGAPAACFPGNPIVAAAGASVVLSLSSTSGLSYVTWRIKTFPTGFAPAGWTLQDGAWIATGITASPAFSLAVSGFATYLVEAIPTYGDEAPGDPIRGAVYVLGTGGLRQPAFGETDEVDTKLHWIGAVQTAIAALATAGGGGIANGDSVWLTHVRNDFDPDNVSTGAWLNYGTAGVILAGLTSGGDTIPLITYGDGTDEVIFGDYANAVVASLQGQEAQVSGAVHARMSYDNTTLVEGNASIGTRVNAAAGKAVLLAVDGTTQASLDVHGLGLFGVSGYGGGTGILALRVAGTAPTSSVGSTGFIWYGDDGHFHVREAGGTTFALGAGGGGGIAAGSDTWLSSIGDTVSGTATTGFLRVTSESLIVAARISGNDVHLISLDDGGTSFNLGTTQNVTVTATTSLTLYGNAGVTVASDDVQGLIIDHDNGTFIQSAIGKPITLHAGNNDVALIEEDGVRLLGAPDLGGGQGVLAIGQCNVPPTTLDSSTVYLYADGGSLYVAGGDGSTFFLEPFNDVQISPSSINVTGTGGTITLHNVTTAPATPGAGQGVIYLEAGALKFKGHSGTVTVIGAA